MEIKYKIFGKLLSAAYYHTVNTTITTHFVIHPLPYGSNTSLCLPHLLGFNELGGLIMILLTAENSTERFTSCTGDKPKTDVHMLSVIITENAVLMRTCCQPSCLQSLPTTALMCAQCKLMLVHWMLFLPHMMVALVVSLGLRLIGKVSNTNRSAYKRILTGCRVSCCSRWGLKSRNRCGVFNNMKYQSPHMLSFTPKALCLSEGPVFELHTRPNIMQADSTPYKYALTLMQNMM